MPRKQRSLDRVLGRVDNLDAVNLANLVQRLARERGFFEAVFEAVREGVLVMSERGIVEYANDAGCRMIGLKDADVGRASLWRLVPGLRQSLDLALGEGIGERAAITLVVRAWRRRNTHEGCDCPGAVTNRDLAKLKKRVKRGA